MITLSKQGNVTSNKVLSIDGLSTDTKPTKTVDNAPIGNGSTFYEMDTKKCFKFDEENKTWWPV